MSAPERDMIPKIRTWLMIHIVTIQKLEREGEGDGESLDWKKKKKKKKKLNFVVINGVGDDVRGSCSKCVCVNCR